MGCHGAELPGLSMPNAISGDTSERFDASIGECADCDERSTELCTRHFSSASMFKLSISVTVAHDGRNGPVRFVGSIPNTPLDIAKLAKSLAKKGDELEFCYEAGCCGYGIHRQLSELGHKCAVIAPSKIPHKPADRIKTDRRDSEKLAINHRSGDLIPVWVPDETHEAMRAFGRYARERRQERELSGAPPTFNFLGLTHCCGRSRDGKFMLVRRTMRTRLTGKIREVTLEMRRRMHQPIAQQGRWLEAVVRGHYAYYGVPTNIHALGAFQKAIAKAWYKSLRRRSQRRRLNWTRMQHIATRWIPAARIVHPWPNTRFAARPTIRAQCGNSARWDLYGGRFESS